MYGWMGADTTLTDGRTMYMHSWTRQSDNEWMDTQGMCTAYGQVEGIKWGCMEKYCICAPTTFQW